MTSEITRSNSTITLDEDILTNLQELTQSTVEDLRTWLLKRNIILGTVYIRKGKLLKMIQKQLIHEKLPQPFEIPELAIIHVGKMADSRDVCMLANTCKRMYSILSSNGIWKEKCRFLDSYNRLSQEQKEKRRENGYWKMWFNNNFPITISLQAPVMETWTTSKGKRDIYTPTIGTLLQRDELRQSPAGVMLTYSTFFVCTKIIYFTKGNNKDLPKTIWVAADAIEEAETIEDFEDDQKFTFTLSTQREVRFSAKGYLRAALSVVSRKDIYP